ncbi:MAG: DNA polymerase III subunit alpha, partial [Chloroflexi bacterium]|nr:DNA polymerase III subunit alpha [Chloroflexota bacterium]
MNAYIELHAHSCFSLLDGAATPEALLDRAVEIGMPALALTDHDGLYAAVRFALAAKERGIRPIIGAELTMLDETHLVLLAENRVGYQNLCWLISRAQLSQSKAHARLAWGDLSGHTDGLIALSACKQGAVATSLWRGARAEAERRAAELRELFAPQCCYIELQQHLHPEDAALAEALAEVAHAVRLPLVATNDVHYAQRSGRYLQDVLVAIRHTGTLQECRRYLRSNSEYYLKAGAELAPLLAAWPQALENTGAIAERCRLELDFRADAIPPAAAETQAENAHLRELCWEGLPPRYPHDRAAAERQAEHELEVITKTGLAGYFLLVWDIVRYAKERGIQVRGRGSAANSIVAYLLGITGVDPLAHGLLFERFLSAEARVMPDIDLDFCSRRREEVVQYVYDKYGEEHVGMVCNYVTYRERSAVRDVGKALGLPLETVDRLAKTLGKWGHGGQADEVAVEMGVLPQTWQHLCTLSAAIEGYPRHLSIHVGGM